MKNIIIVKDLGNTESIKKNRFKKIILNPMVSVRIPAGFDGILNLDN